MTKFLGTVLKTIIVALDTFFSSSTIFNRYNWGNRYDSVCQIYQKS